MADIKLGINLNCFTNRFPEPEEWTRIVQELGIKYVQFNADIIDPFSPWDIQKRIISETRRLCVEREISILSSFGGQNHHQNYLGHPDPDMAKWYEEFYKRLIEQAALLGCGGVGTCYAIMSVRDAADSGKRSEILKRAADAYIRLAEFAKGMGLRYLLFETTSVPRETCATFEETDSVLNMLKDMAIPMKICLDTGHRNMENPELPETDPYKWIERYGSIAPVIDIHQSNNKASSHWPFTPEYNELGDIDPGRVVASVERSGAGECMLAFEIKHKAYYPEEYKVVDDLKESVKYWRKWVKN